MSSRWDSLKPSSSSQNNEARGDHPSRPTTTSTNHHQQQQQQQPHRNSRGKWQPGAKRNTTALGSSRNGRNGADKQAGRDQGSSWRKPENSNAEAQSTPSSPEWEKLVRCLWDWRKAVKSENKDTNKNVNEEANITSVDNEKLAAILQELCCLLKQSTSRSITGAQRGNALAAALHALNHTQENRLIWNILDWSCQLLDFSIRHNHPGDLRMTALQAQISITGLASVQHCAERDETTRAKYQQCCMNILIHCAPQLPPEETAHQLVGGVLLPSLQALLHTPLASTEEDQEAGNGQVLLQQGIQALQSLLTEKNHASAFLAPLVNDVGADGQELYLVNPLRRRIFQVLQCGVEQSSQLSTTLKRQMHKCLTLALQMANVVDKSSSLTPATKRGGSTGKQQVDLDSLVMENFFKVNLNKDTVELETSNPQSRILVLELLQTYLIMQPAASLSLGTLLLLQDNPRRPATDTENAGICPTCSCRASSSSSPYPPFLTLLHNSENQEESGLAMASLAIMVSNIPWKLLMGRKSPQGYRLQNSSVSNYSMRVIDAIKSIVMVSNCLLVARWESNHCTEWLGSLMRAVLLDIPFESCVTSSSHSQGVEKAACGLIETLASKLLQTKARKSALVDSMTEVFEESMGGRLTPQGFRTAMIYPAKSWLASPSSQVFFDGLFDGISDAARTNTQEKVVTSKIAVKLLRSILGTHPQTVLNTAADWKVFHDSIVLLCNTEITAVKQSGLQLLESLLQGRKCASQEKISGESSQVVHLALSVLPRMVASASGPCRSLSFQAYGSLLGSDWLKQLDEKRDGQMKYHVELILSHCGGSGQAASVRSAACKAVGDICSSCFLEEKDLESVSLAPNEHLRREEQLRNVGDGVCVAMLKSMEDSNATVRSMAIFAVGNLAQVMGCCNFNNILDPNVLKKVCLAVYRCLKDENDKVSSNAIRSIGHLAVVVLSESYRTPLIDIPWDLDGFCHDVVLALSEKINSVPTVLAGTHGTGLSWKQRSNIKKHGRVACNSLALLLQHRHFSEMSTHVGVFHFQSALGSLFKCIECLGTTLDEKVIIAAMLAFRALPSSSLARVSGKSGLVGKALVTCISFLAKEQWSKGAYVSSGKLFLQVDLLCEHLIDSTTIFDATIVLNCGEIADSWMGQLYEWMVFRNCSARTFGAFALALQTPGIRLPVLVEQNFANRATNLLRNEDLAQDSDDEL